MKTQTIPLLLSLVLGLACQPLSLVGKDYGQGLQNGDSGAEDAGLPVCQLQPDPAGPCDSAGQCSVGACVNGNCFWCMTFSGACTGCVVDAGSPPQDAGTDAGTDGDGGSCQPISGVCNVNSDCCSNNCITRTTPGYCCVQGGCP